MALVMVGQDKAAPRKFLLDNGDHRVTLDYFGRSSGNGTDGEAFLIGVENRTLAAHFHPVDQFQILLGDEGSLFGRTPVPKLMLHYADAFTTYGPLVGATPPLRFITIRAAATDVTAYMPKDRKLLAYRGRRNFHVDPYEVAPDVPRAPGAVDVTSLIDNDDDGLGALMFCTGANATIEVPSSAGTSGQYLYVADGTVSFNNEWFGEESLGWLGAEDGPTTLTAGPDGSRVLVLRYPLPATPFSHGNIADAGRR